PHPWCAAVHGSARRVYALAAALRGGRGINAPVVRLTPGDWPAGASAVPGRPARYRPPAGRLGAVGRRGGARGRPPRRGDLWAGARPRRSAATFGQERDDQVASMSVEEITAHLEQVARDHGAAAAVLLAPTAIFSVTEPLA